MPVRILLSKTMRYLGIDYGKKRIGVAVSDEEGRIAFPRGIVGSIKELARFIARERIEKIIVGLPRSFDGSETAQTREVRKFAEKLKKEVSIPIEFENELLTTHMVEKEGVSKAHVDESAAAVILQSHLDKQARSS